MKQSKFKIVAIVPIKNHSSRIPDKNFKLFNGKPLYHWIIEKLILINEIEKIIINTDSTRILNDKEILNHNKIILRKRKKNLVGDHVSVNKIISDDMNAIDSDIYLMTHTTNPLLEIPTIRKCIKEYKRSINSKKFDSLFTVNKILDRLYDNNFNSINHKKYELIRTQDLPKIFQENSNLYIFSKDSFKKNNSRLGTKPYMYEMNLNESVDIDDFDNWYLAESLYLKNMKTKNSLQNLKKRISQNQLTIGTWLTLPSASIAEILSQKKFDWITVDLEHSSIGNEKMEDLIRVIDNNNSIPLVRLTSNNPDQIKRAMDCGAKGIIIPMIKNVSDIKNAINALYYPPKGKRSVGLARAQAYGEKFNEYISSEKNNLLIIQVEHIDCVKNLDKILSFKEIDSFIIGPYDLSASMGIPGDFKNRKFINILNKIKKVAKSKKRSYGYHIIEPNPEELNQKIKEGYKFLAYSIDTRVINSGYNNIKDYPV